MVAYRTILRCMKSAKVSGIKAALECATLLLQDSFEGGASSLITSLQILLFDGVDNGKEARLEGMFPCMESRRLRCPRECKAFAAYITTLLRPSEEVSSSVITATETRNALTNVLAIDANLPHWKWFHNWLLQKVYDTALAEAKDILKAWVAGDLKAAMGGRELQFAETEETPSVDFNATAAVSFRPSELQYTALNTSESVVAFGPHLPLELTPVETTDEIHDAAADSVESRKEAFRASKNAKKNASQSAGLDLN
eukprot:g1832.t1